MLGFPPCGNQHGVAKIAAIHGGRAAVRLKGEHQVTGATAHVEHAGSGFSQNVRYSRHGAGAPIPVDIHRQHVIQQIVARDDLAEHAAHPSGRLTLVVGAGGRGSLT